ncbi:hypothetical protein KEM60_01254 [Austwickia sp. TVS 96-490-7B]|nr:hypothetical protein [Austwickia sp. TVS 96-490-7B]
MVGRTPIRPWAGVAWGKVAHGRVLVRSAWGCVGESRPWAGFGEVDLGFCGGKPPVGGCGVGKVARGRVAEGRGGDLRLTPHLLM